MDTARTDAELVERSLAGEREAFAALVERHSPAVWGALRRLVGDFEEAREALQDTWVRAFERLGSLEEPARVRSWLLSVALNRGRESLRRPRPERLGDQQVLGEDPSGPPSAWADRADAPSERREARSDLDRAVAELPPRQRAVVLLRVGFDRDYASIARELGTTPESARASFYQAMKKLRDRLGEDATT